MKPKSYKELMKLADDDNISVFDFIKEVEKFREPFDRAEEEKVKCLAEEIGYGRLLEIAQKLWDSKQ